MSYKTSKWFTIFNRILTKTAQALCHHFDPNGDKNIRYGEFCWAFFNRRVLARKWRRVTQGLTSSQIREKFHRFDKNGDGQLSKKEFHKLLLSFKIDLTDNDLDAMITKFDRDGDRCINMHEFKVFFSRYHTYICIIYDSLRIYESLRIYDSFSTFTYT